MRSFCNQARGFTIVELVVVIGVIAILATITAVLYPGYMQSTRDSQRKSDLAQIASAIQTYAIRENNFVEQASGCGFFGYGNGWYNLGPNAFFPKSIDACLQESKLLNGTFKDPSGCENDSGGECGTSSGNPVRAYMKATCRKNGNKVTYVLAHLETEPRKNTEVDELCDSGTVEGFTAASQRWGTLYGMNYYTVVR